MEKMRDICFINVNEDGLFTLWDKPYPDINPDTQPFIFNRDEMGMISVEPIPDQLPDRKTARLAAAFAISNMGHQVPDDIAEGDWLDWESTPRHAIDNLAGHLMEDESHDELWAGEAEMWYDQIQSKGVQRMYHHREDCDWFKKIILA